MTSKEPQRFPDQIPSLMGSLVSLLLFLFVPTIGLAAEPGATLVIPKKEAWTGQRVPIFIELRAEGSFKSSASFDIPEIPQTVVIKVGNPVLSSETDGGNEVFVQSHEFALFSQASGNIEFPPITARFSHTKGYTGPVFDASYQTESVTLTLKRPPNSESLGFLVTTDSLTIEETWDPKPGPLETGAVLKRTIVQRASQQTGIALKPAPTPEIEGIRTYPATPKVSDKTERGTFLGERRETITYLVQQPGLHTLPEIRFDWWNPSTETLESKTLPAITFTATAPPTPPAKPSPLRYLWLVPVVIVLGLAAFYRRSIASGLHELHDRIDPPQRRAARQFVKACRSNDPAASIAAWNHFRQFDSEIISSVALKEELGRLNSMIYGIPKNQQEWTGEALARAFRQSQHHPAQADHVSQLPELNP
ncbi:hypothetical protein ACFQY0_16440 [Haloferula chungangensis]|uniref:DUF7939 domain-containing protein n=1 Tax=Haloferula chungangensis TaxID=1048331 RepID=A0ABW2LBB4_9BACT